MRTMGRALLLLLVVAFVAGVWDARYGEEAHARPLAGPVPDRAGRAGPADPAGARAASRSRPTSATATTGCCSPSRARCRATRSATCPRSPAPAGGRLPLRGAAFVEVAFEPARARDPDGTPTFPAATITPSSPALRQVRFAGDFEGQVSFGLGVAGRGGFRVSELRNPTRVAVDVR